MVSRTLKYISFVIFTLDALCGAYRILVVFPIPSRSHNLLGYGYVNHLLEAGHEVTFVTSYPKKVDLPPRLKEVDVSSITRRLAQNARLARSIPKQLKDIATASRENAIDSKMLTFTASFNKIVLENEAFVEFAADLNENFDVVIVEWFFSELLAGLAPLFQCPLIWADSIKAHWQNMRLVDGVINPAYSLDVFSTNELPLTFWERYDELKRILKRIYIMYFTVIPFEREAYNEMYPMLAIKRGVTEIPDYDEAVYNGSLIFLNFHPSMGIAYKVPQNAKHIGGYHLSTKNEALPKDLQKIMDAAKHGVIYFSMGSNLQSKGMSSEMKVSLLKIFAKFDQVILWKFEEDLDDVPKNVHLLKWAPQQSILGHSNIKVFVTHGGQLSTIEAVHFGVPIVGIPFFGDHYVNINLAVKKGYCIKVEFNEDLAYHLEIAIKEVIENPSYRERAKELSGLFHDRPLSPGAELVYWVEHVVRTQGAPHLRSPALMVPWYQKIYLDLLALILITLLTLTLFSTVLKYCLHKILCRKENKLKLY